MKSMCFFFLGIAFVSIFLCGCEKVNNPDGAIKVSGEVLVDGQPMKDVSVIFRPITAGVKSATGATDANGKFTLTTGAATFGTGAMPGEYHALFSKQGFAEDDEKLSSEEQLQKYGETGPPLHNIVPPKYNSEKTSGLAPVLVEKGAENHFKFELTTEK